MLRLIVGVCLITCVLAGVFDAPNTVSNRQVMVHLFEWKWTDIAKECEIFLQYYNYGAVQVSPPMEHIVLETNGDRPWWIRYQPVSYKLQSRSGTRAQFIDMVQRCNKVGVRIIVDAVLNHMVGVGETKGVGGKSDTDGSYFQGTNKDEKFSGVPYSASDFNDNSCDRNIQNSDFNNNAWAVRTCRLVGLLDLTQGNSWVAGKIGAYLKDCMNIGVAGFRVDAEKHMWPQDLANIYNSLGNVISDVASGSKPFIVGEVDSSPAVTQADYVGCCGRVTNFNFGRDVSAAASRSNNFKYFGNFGTGWGLPADNDVLNFIDNHDTQRNGGVLTYKSGQSYKIAVTYMLAWNYGYPRVMSSYYFNSNDQGPPSTGSPNYYTNSPSFNSDLTCNANSGWVCEHRWPEVRRMVDFRSVVSGTGSENIITDNHRIAFSRGNKGWFMVNNQGSSWSGNFYTGLPSGTYCDIITGEVSGQSCTGTKVTVESTGHATISVAGTKTFGIHIGGRSRIGGGGVSTAKPSYTTVPVTQGPTQPPPSGFSETVVFLYDPTMSGQNLFIRGGTNLGKLVPEACPGNNNNLASNPCAIPIKHDTVVPTSFHTYRDWEAGDNYLDWNGPEPGQGTYDGQAAAGTPLAWSTNDPSNTAYQKLNTFGPNYWMVSVKMDCSKTENGWFELKGYQPWAGGWESDISQGTCTGSVGGQAPVTSRNHMARCGYVNVFKIGQNDCIINSF